MSGPVITPPLETRLQIEGGGYFPVRRVYCVGRNYADHTREMGGDPHREAPFFFSKPRDAVLQSETIAYPPATTDLHHEVELVLALGAGGMRLSPDEALSRVYGAAVGVDLTRRDLQVDAKAAGRPWDAAKGFDQSAPIGMLRPGPAPETGAITLSVNGVQRQSGNLKQMIWSGAEIIACLSILFELYPGDLIYTGTPAGVGAVAHGDVIDAHAASLPALRFEFV